MNYRLAQEEHWNECIYPVDSGSNPEAIPKKIKRKDKWKNVFGGNKYAIIVPNNHQI